MDKQIITELNKKASEFGKIAKKVNESSKKRKKFAEKVMKDIETCLGIEESLGKDVVSFANFSIDFRNQDTIVFNTCKILKNNMDNQKQLLNEIQSQGLLDRETCDQLSLRIKELFLTIEETLANVQRIIEKDNFIIFMDSVVKKRKAMQNESILKLKELTEKIISDSEKAVNGSSSNLKRGLQMAESFMEAEKFLKSKNKKELTRLKNEANAGWNIACEVNKSSKSQYKFAEKVNKFTKDLYDDSVKIRDLVVKKHHEFEENLQLITVLTIILSIKFKKYLSIEDVIKKIEINDANRELVLDLIIKIQIACLDIKHITSLNYDMTDSSNAHNVIEDRFVKDTRKEIEHFEAIRENVASMTEATKYPVQGSGENIENGKALEKNIEKLMTKMK